MNFSQNDQKWTDRQVAKLLVAKHNTRVAKLENGIENLRNENIDLMSERQRLQNILKSKVQ